MSSEGEWFIRPGRVRQFIVDHVALVGIHKCDKYWLIDLFANEMLETNLLKANVLRCYEYVVPNRGVDMLEGHAGTSRIRRDVQQGSV